MKIPQQLHQFSDAPAWIITTGTQEAVGYRLAEGTITEQFSYRAQKEEDTQGRNMTVMKGGGKTIAHSIPVDEKQEKIKKKVIDSFLSELDERIKGSDLTGSEIYLFVPSSMEDDVRGCVPEAHSASIKGVIHGNFVHEHPLRLVERIDELKKDKKVTPTDEEAAKILRRGPGGTSK